MAVNKGNKKAQRKQLFVRIMALALAALMVLGVGIYIFILIGGGF